MHGTFDRSGETLKNIYRDWGTGIFVLPVLLVALLVGLAITKPEVSNRISEAAQAEFANSSPLLEVAPAQIARPSMEIRSAGAN